MLKKQLGEALRALRQSAGVTVPQAAAELGSGEGKVRHIENGRNVPSKPDLTVMIGLYGASPDVHQELEELRQAATSKGWWSSYRLPTWLQNYVGLEADASLIRIFALELIPGLLQIEHYAREVQTLGQTVKLVNPADAERHIASKRKRQELLVADQPPEFHAVISEAALHRVRGSEFAAEQYRHLLAMAGRSNITLQVLPFSRRLHPSMSGGFVLLDFPEGVSAPAAYFEYAIASQLEGDQKIVARMSEVFDQITELSLSADASVDFITEWI